MNYAFLTVSMLSMVIKNCVFNMSAKKILKTDSDMYKFNSVVFLLCAIIFSLIALTGRLSGFTALLGIGFALSTFLSTVFSMKALSQGPMHITVLITTSSMIIPTVFGMMFSDEALSLLKIIAILALIFFISLSNGKSSGGQASKKWLLYVMITFLATGTVGVLQKIHQSSVYKDELFGFLATNFVLSYVFALIKSRTGEKTTKLTSKHYLLAIISGACVFAMNLINLRLSGIIPSQVFFPLVNGGSVILSTLSSIFIFKEKITVKQTIGLLGGMLSLAAICML